MRLLGHHIYTSFGGQRTAFLSPWLESQRALLETRARHAYLEVGLFDCVQQDGRWIATFVIANGVDHVNRPRSLVHQVILDTRSTPVVFSPLFLRLATLSRLEHDDPALGHRLVTDLDTLDLRSLMPAPDSLASLLRGPVRPLIAALLSALGSTDGPVRLEVLDFHGIQADFAAALSLVLVHGPEIQISSFARPLPVPDPEHAIPCLMLSSGQNRRMDKKSVFLDMTSILAAEDLLDLICDAPQPPRVLFLLRWIPLAALLKHHTVEELHISLMAADVHFDRDGVPIMPPTDPRSHRVVACLIACAAQPLATAILEGWRTALMNTGAVSPDWVAACNACLADPQRPGITDLCRQLLQEQRT